MKYDNISNHDQESDFKYHEWEREDDDDRYLFCWCGGIIPILEYVDKKLEESK